MLPDKSIESNKSEMTIVPTQDITIPIACYQSDIAEIVTSERTPLI